MSVILNQKNLLTQKMKNCHYTKQEQEFHSTCNKLHISSESLTINESERQRLSFHAMKGQATFTTLS